MFHPRRSTCKQLPRDPRTGCDGSLGRAHPYHLCRAQRFREEQSDQAGGIRRTGEPPRTGRDRQAYQSGVSATRRDLSRAGSADLPEQPRANIHRVSERVAQGGHEVPDEDVRRRYVRSIANANRVLRIVHEALVFDNSGTEPKPIFEVRGGRVQNIAAEIPAWAATLLEGPRGQK